MIAGAPARSRGYGRAALFLLALALVYACFEFVLPRSLPHPVHTDDYSIVTGGFADLGWQWKRPVSSNLIFIIAQFGQAASYGVLSILAVLDAALVLLLLGRLFAVRLGIAPVLMFGIIVFSHVSAFYHATYLGLLTNLISHLFGLATLLALHRGWRAASAPMLALAAGAYVLSAFAKEDFLLPPLLLAGFLAFTVRDSDPPTIGAGAKRRRGVAVAALVAICVGSMLWNAHARNPFVAGLFSPATSSPAYAVELSPGVMLHTYWTLLGGWAPFASFAALLACGWLALAMRRLRPALVWYLATVALLVLPYAVIPHNMSAYRVYAWLPWLAGIVAIALQVATDRFAGTAAFPRVRIVAATAGLAIAALAAWSHHAARTKVASDYARAAGANRRMVEALVAQRAAIGEAPVVGLVGLEGPSPWCAKAYVHDKLGFHNRWIAFVPQESACYRQRRPDATRQSRMHMTTDRPEKLCGHRALPVLEYGVDGSGRLRRASDYCTPAMR